MRKIKDDKLRKRYRRKIHIRKKISGSADRPRITVYKSNQFTYVQAIDDVSGRTLASVSNKEKDLRKIGNKTEVMEQLGDVLGKRLKQAKIGKAVFDRNGYAYHGKVKKIAEGIRKTGIHT